MGAGIALSLAMHGQEVNVVDRDQSETDRQYASLLERIAVQHEAGLIAEGSEALAARLVKAASLEEAVRDAWLVVEAASEDRAVKDVVLRRISDAAGTGAVIVSNTSSLPVDDLAASVSRPERFLGLHFFHPAEWIPGVEVAPGRATEPAAVEAVVSFMEAVGKLPAVVAPNPGYIANRLQMALFLEAVACVEEGLASYADVDRVVRSTFGIRLPGYGPFAIADMAGLEVYASVLGVLHAQYGERFAVPDRLAALVAAGRFGAKTGSGFHDYSGVDQSELVLERNRRYRDVDAAANGMRVRRQGAGWAPGGGALTEGAPRVG
jgi:3-hydroxybutyryl-CoA dehydrogenase